MLHYTTVEPYTLELLKRLSSEPALKDYLLVGGTALSLQIGHRKSIDLDFFCYGEFDANAISQLMAAKYGYKEVRFSDTMSIGYIQNIKIDFVKARNKLTTDIVNEDGIRLADKQDIAAMKLWAIAKDGTRMKDFIDIACLSTSMSLKTMLDTYCKAYNTDSAMFATKKLLYFKSIDNFESINMLHGKFEWSLIQQRLKDMVLNPDLIFPELPLNFEKKKRKSKAQRLFLKWKKAIKAMAIKKK